MLAKSNLDQNIRYIVANERDMCWGLTVCSIGFQQIAPHDVYPPKCHPESYFFSPNKGRVLDEYQLIYITHGGGKFCSQSQKTIFVKEGTMVLLFPGEWHTYYPAEKTGWDEYFIGFKGNAMDQRVKESFLSKSRPIFQIGIDDRMVYLYREAMKTSYDERTGFQQVLSGIANLLIGLTYSIDKGTYFESKRIQHQIDKARVIMRENTGKEISPETIAKQLNMSYSQFRKTFKEYTGFAPLQYIQELKLQQAKDLLRTTQYSIKEIASMLNFDDVEYFFMFFKKKLNQTPTEYRNFSRGKTTDTIENIFSI
jgi:AraC-like DNA-binding protein